MTRTDFGEKYTYNGPLDLDYFMTWSFERLHQLAVGDWIIGPEYPEAVADYEIRYTEPQLCALERKAIDALNLVQETRLVIAQFRSAHPDLENPGIDQ